MSSSAVFIPLMFMTLTTILATTSATKEVDGSEFDAIRLRGHEARSDTSLLLSSIVVSSSMEMPRRTKKKTDDKTDEKKINEKNKYSKNKSERTAENLDVENNKDGGTTTITTAPNMDGGHKRFE